jgi:RHS repeat-associated protein
VNVAEAPVALALSGNGARLYVLNSNPSSAPRRASISVIDTAARSRLGTDFLLATVGSVEQIALSRDETRAYVSVGAAIDIIDLATRAVTTVTTGIFGPADSSDIVIAPDGRRAYVSNRTADTVSVIDTEPTSPTFHTVIATIPVGPGNSAQPYGLALDATRQRLYVSNRVGSSIAIVNTATNGVDATIPLSRGPLAGSTQVVLSPDGGRLYEVSGFSTVAVVDTATRAQIGVFETGRAGLGDIAITSDGASLLVVAGGPSGALLRLSTTSGQVTDTLPLALPTGVSLRGAASAFAYVVTAGNPGSVIVITDSNPLAGGSFGLTGSAGNLSGSASEPVNTATGNYYLQRTDLALPGRGTPVVFTRTYNSQDPYSGPLGVGWTHTYNVSLVEGTDGVVTVKHADGREERYAPQGGGQYICETPGIFSVLQKNSDGSFVLTFKNLSQYRFGQAGSLTAIVDRNANVVTLSYGGDGNLRTITDTVGRSVALTYDGSNRIVQLMDPIGRIVRYAYDTQGDLTSATDPAGGVMTFAYDASHRMVEIRDQRGNVLVANTYDQSGRVVAQANGRGLITAFAYGTPRAEDTSITDPRGQTTIHTHDTDRRLLYVTDSDGGVLGFGYDANNNRTRITDQNGHTTSFAYDGRGNVTTIADALGRQIRLTYDSQNNLTTVTNARGATTRFTYDTRGNLIALQNALGQVTSFSYDSVGQLIRRTDARGNATQFGYDARGSLTRITDALSGATTLAYDGIGRLTALIDPLGRTVASTHDLLSRLVQVKDPLGNVTRFTYDPVGNLTELQDAKGSKTRYGYDEVSNLTTVTDAIGSITRYAYDANNNRIEVTNAKGNRSSYVFDALNRLAESIDPLGHRTQYEHDAVGNVVAVTNPNGVTNAFGYDAGNRLLAITYGDGTSVHYSYDENGNRVGMTDSRGVATYQYDALDRVIFVTDSSGSVRYAYDEAGNRTTLTYPDGKLVTYSYDALNRQEQVSDRAGRVIRYRYDAASNLVQILYPNGRGITYQYDAANRLQQVAHRLGAVLTARFAYILDPVGNRLRVTRDLALSPLPLSVTSVFDYNYDALSQLTAFEEIVGNLRLRRTEYAYDAVGNRQSVKEFSFLRGNPVLRRTTLSSYDAADRLLQAGDVAYTHDANGNRLTELGSDRNISYRYDAADRLVGVGRGIAKIAYSYDGDGNKAGRSLDEGSEVKRTEFTSDITGALPVTIRETGTEGTRSYVYGLSLVEEELAASPGFVVPFFYHADGLGSTIALTDMTGKPAAGYQYDPWGNPEISLGNAPNRFLFTGEERDAASGLYYLRARWYDPSVGRFLNRDPLAGRPELPQSQHRYSYALLNPVRYVDPSGLGVSELILSAVKLLQIAKVADETNRELGACLEKNIELCTPDLQMRARTQQQNLIFSAGKVAESAPSVIYDPRIYGIQIPTDTKVFFGALGLPGKLRTVIDLLKEQIEGLFPIAQAAAPPSKPTSK